ncbi:helix-turn-helix domain-containing protein [Lentibacillus saliphilus]|uniref:helix-turn-helix domain-containing protein n=1 Tax=Lentibacillus saliphilus TaxID=2737028 RepID=UPI001C30D280|nr:helix-turn-helix domain-containing protein [Lentibacillus saliphilus]
MGNYLTTKEVAQVLEVAVPTIYKYVRERKLKPVYDDKWQIDETLLFAPEDVERLEEEMVKPGLTTGDVADELGIHPSTVASYIKRGIIKAEKHHYMGRELFFVTREELDTFKQHHNLQQRRNSKSFYSKKTGLYLFQALLHEETNALARIMELNHEDGKIVTENGEMIALSEMDIKGFSPIEHFTDRPYITKKGYVSFKFEKPYHIASPIFNIIEILYKESGYKNIRLQEADGHIYLDIKPMIIQSLTEDKHPHEIGLLKRHITEGKISIRHNGVMLDSGLERLTIHLPSKLKEAVVTKAKEQHLSIDDYVEKLLQEQLTKA